MPRLNKETREQIKNMPQKELAKILIKAASMEKSVFDYLYVNYINKAEGEQELFERTKTEISSLFFKRYKGFTEQLQTKNMLSECTKFVNNFTKTCNNKVLEADLLLHILKFVFSYPDDFFGTAFTAFDTKTAQILKRLITIVTKKIHEDYLIEYQENINKYLQILHKQSNHIDYIYDLPKEI